MELKETIKNLNKQLEHIKKANECGLATKGEFKEDIENLEIAIQVLEDFKEGNIVSLKLLEKFYLVNKDKEKQMTLVNKELFDDYIPKKEIEELITQLESKNIYTTETVGNPPCDITTVKEPTLTIREVIYMLKNLKGERNEPITED